jgi:transcriptional regulator with XRE-family HTH domain
MIPEDDEAEDHRRTRHIDTPLGDALRLERDARNLSREWLAQRLGVSTSTVQRYENGSQRVPAARLWQICGIYGVTVSELFAGLPHHVVADPAHPAEAETGTAFEHDDGRAKRIKALTRNAARLTLDRLEIAEILVKALKPSAPR